VADGVAVARPLATDVAAFSHGIFLCVLQSGADALGAVATWLEK
jgi:zinc transporter ZupT